jgi:hypothetical protein
MRHRRILVGAIAGASIVTPVALAAAAPGSHHAAHHPIPFGTVVDWRAASHTATIARPSGQLLAVHTRSRLAVGTTVAARHLTRLKNGTYAGTLVRDGRVRRVRVRGVVVADLRGRGFALGAAGTTFVVHSGHHGASWKNSAAQESVPVGSTVIADVQVGSGGSLSEIDVHDLTSATAPVEISGILTAMDPVAGTIVVTDTHDGVTTAYTIEVPPTVDMSTLTLGQEIHVLATPNPDGTYSLAVAPVTLQLEGTITAIDTTANTITVTNTDDGVTLSFVIDIPSSVDIGSFQIGVEVELQVVQNADGTYSLAQSCDNSDGEDAGGSSVGGGAPGLGLWTPSGGGSSDSRSRG